MKMKEYKTPELQVIEMKTRATLLDMSDPNAGNPGTPEELP